MIFYHLGFPPASRAAPSHEPRFVGSMSSAPFLMLEWRRTWSQTPFSLCLWIFPESYTWAAWALSAQRSGSRSNHSLDLWMCVPSCLSLRAHLKALKCNQDGTFALYPQTCPSVSLRTQSFSSKYLVLGLVFCSSPTSKLAASCQLCVQWFSTSLCLHNHWFRPPPWLSSATQSLLIGWPACILTPLYALSIQKPECFFLKKNIN